tara:strand:+ start:6826 stop:7482 length:657 start_codon:yes stop_codon:yes gene_type:complete
VNGYRAKYQPFITLLLILCIWSQTLPAFTLKSGDLLFSEEPCGDFCDAIEQSTDTLANVHINHVAIARNDHQVIEAISTGVKLTSLSEFLHRAKHPNNKQTIWVKRMKKNYAKLIPEALQFADEQIGKPYNASFTDDSDSSFYCSQLITQSFYHANHDQTVFQLIPMNFNNLKTHQPITAWQEYFDHRHETMPQGVLGSNPVQLFKNSRLTLVHRYTN